jgi:hypothetical protein
MRLRLSQVFGRSGNGLFSKRRLLLSATIFVGELLQSGASVGHRDLA